MYLVAVGKRNYSKEAGVEEALPELSNMGIYWKLIQKQKGTKIYMNKNHQNYVNNFTPMVLKT